MRKFTLKDRKMSIVSRVLTLSLWLLLSTIVDNEVIFPSIKMTLIHLISIIKEPNFLKIIGYSILRSFIGFLISLFLSIILGILSSLSNFIFSFMTPILNFLSSVPTMAIIILALIWIDNEFVPVFVGFIMIFPILYERVLNAILNIDKKIIDMAQLYKVDKSTIIKDLYIPSIFVNLDFVFISTLGTNLKMVIAGEALAQPKYAIGSSLRLQKTYLNISGVFAWIIIILLIAKVLELIMIGIKQLLNINKWKW